MHYCVFVMIGPDTHIETAVAQALAPFDEDLTVKEYRIHFDVDEVQRMARHFKIPPSHLHELARKMPGWTGNPGGVDCRGLYRVVSHNPDGYWDWYEIGGRWDGSIPNSTENTIRAESLYNGKHLKRCLPYAILTPDGEWIEREHVYFSGIKFVVHQIKPKQWLKIVRDILTRWPDHQVVCVDIHR